MNQQQRKLPYGDFRQIESSKKKPGDWHYVNGVAVQIGATVVNIRQKAAQDK